ncbi:ABC transporter permease [Roseivirga sp. E12]|uniref:ABC transporter permease n=1 Tax=Roseivirga sp. E12 TaxID=2819237 RepID=UPI001ABC1C90|nr:ABC transporter permease [Roseivirga sp. E12]MBO3696978.1 ABC transporter permease [Roseivirga sp. E12]
MSTNNPIKPPKLATRIFKAYCKNELADSILGDMQEQFFKQAEHGKPMRAKLRYWQNVLTFVNRHTLKSDKPNPWFSKNHTSMLRNYTLVTFRNLKKNPLFSLINLLGLAVGLASSLIIFLYIQQELSFDSFHRNADQIYRVTSTYARPSATYNWVRTPPALAPAIKNNFPGIGKVTRLRSTDEHVYFIEDDPFILGRGFYADSMFLEMMDYPLAMGNPLTALDEPNSIVISSDLAMRFFGNQNPMGKIIRFDNELPLRVTGVLEELPSNTHLDFELLISFTTYVVPEGYLADLNSWSWGGFYTFVELNADLDVDQLEERVTGLYEENYTRTDTKVTAHFQPLKKLYLDYGHFTNHGDLVRLGDKNTIFTLMAIAILVLIVASLNYMNLSTAISLNRGKEIGMRKVMGAVSGRIKAQFLWESILLALASMFIAIGLTWLAQPLFSDLLQIELPTDVAGMLGILPVLLGVTLLIGFLAGLYPSFVLSTFSPIKALRGRLKTSAVGNRVRKGLTVFQFVVSIVLLTGSFLIIKQTQFMREQPLGFETENVLILNVLGVDMNERYDVLKNTMLRNPFVTGFSESSHQFSNSSSSGPAHLEGAPPSENFQLNYYQTGYDFIDLMDLEITQGRFFSKDFPNDTASAMILNETAVAQMKLEDPVGQRIQFNNRDRVVVGVVKDFNYSSLHAPVAPMAIVMPFTIPSTFLIKTQGDNLTQVISSIESDYKNIIPEAPFDIKFLDDDIARMYDQEIRLSRLVGLFSSLAVILACLGLYGLVTYSVQARLTEVGIRKVLGGSLSKIMVLLSKQFFILILVANLLAWPLIFWLGSNWLSNFHYRIDLDLSIFLWPTLSLLLIAAITVSHQVIKAAWTNPVKVLRSE